RRHGVEPGQRRGDDRAVERLEPALVQAQPEADGAHAERGDDGGEELLDLAETMSGVHGRSSIVAAWTRTRSRSRESAGSTSTSTPPTSPAPTPTSPTSASRGTSSRSLSRASSTRWKRATS